MGLLAAGMYEANWKVFAAANLIVNGIESNCNPEFSERSFTLALSTALGSCLHTGERIVCVA